MNRYGEEDKCVYCYDECEFDMEYCSEYCQQRDIEESVVCIPDD